MVKLKPAAMAKLTIDLGAIEKNWKTLNAISGTAGAAIKANAYGLGAQKIASTLYSAGCRDFFAANWMEADQLKGIIPQHNISVLNGVDAQNLEYAVAHEFKPVLNTPEQIALWRRTGKQCDIMLDSGINRLGISSAQINLPIFDGLNIDVVMSHLASADEDSHQNEIQRTDFKAIANDILCQRKSLSNSAGIMLGTDYHYNLTRPGLSLYGGIARPELSDIIAPVVSICAHVLQVRTAAKDSFVGYNATYQCDKEMRIATIALGYADGYLRGFSNKGTARFDGYDLPVIGRVSMDLITLDASQADHIVEGDWVQIDYDLSSASRVSGLSQYELLTALGNRFERSYIG